MPMMERVNPKEVSPLSAAPTRGPQAAIAGPGNKGQPLPWQLTWFNDAALELWRAWSPFPQLKPQEQVARLDRPALEKRLDLTDSREHVEPQTSLDRMLHATMGRFTLGLSPYALWLAYADWAIHLAASPGKVQQLIEQGMRQNVRFLTYAGHLASDAGCPACVDPLPQDQRFEGEAWQQLPFKLIYQAFLLNEKWWHNATTGVGGVSRHHEQVVAFMTRQLLDTVSPVNFIPTNPEVLAATIREGGQNLIRGAMNFWADWERAIGGNPPIGVEEYQPGKELAVTKGKVVYRNRLIDSPTTSEVYAEPVLIVPAWIMKYYILDLSPGNSLVKYLVDHGHTVFMISWHNPTAADRDLGMDDYLRLGVIDALKAVQAIAPDSKINGVGYCLGGTLLSIAAAHLAREKSSILNSLTLLAAQTDFTEAGELMLFIDDSQLNYLEDIMWDQGYLDARQMAGTFQFLRSSDLIWSRVDQQYLMGRRSPMIDLIAWNADATRMPYNMHSEYLRRLYLHNDLFEARFQFDGRPVALSDIRAPIFAVSTERDHVAPWRSVYKINLIAATAVTFVLTSGGHNAGIVSEPGHKDRYYRISHRAPGAQYVDPQTWYDQTEIDEGSWWPAWLSWLDQQSHGRTLPPPALGAPGYRPLEDAPGKYVLER